jgi:hypothetical protein
MNPRLQHALHNENVCKFLRSKPEYADWIVTTSFYSAIHFVEFFVFPFDYTANGITTTVKSIYEYKKAAKSVKSKHELRFDLVLWKCPEIEIQYKFLADTCNTARYFDYKLPNPTMALQLSDIYLKKIKAYCSGKPTL